MCYSAFQDDIYYNSERVEGVRVYLHRKWRHQPDNLLRVLGLFSSRDEGWIEIRREVLVEDFTLSHVG